MGFVGTTHGKVYTWSVQANIELCRLPPVLKIKVASQKAIYI